MNKTIMLNVIDMFARTTNGMLHPFYPLVPCGDYCVDTKERLVKSLILGTFSRMLSLYKS